MGKALQERLQQSRPLGSPAEEAAANLLLAAAWLSDRLERALAPFGISHHQYNVLRILRGVHPDGHPRGEIASRMIDRAPDVTRLVDRLEARGLVERARDAGDGRRSLSRLTRVGVALLGRANAAVEEVEKDLGRRLARRELEELSRMCESLYGPGTE